MSLMEYKQGSSHAIRSLFLKYFEAHHHQIVPRSSLIPGNDHTLLFTNSGMVQFKDVFLGFEKRVYQRATSAQPCIRVGGKHNDLEQVGHTARHHTCFEMLGNFSFGDYFKKEAIHFAWTFLTAYLSLPVERLWITVFKDDQEAEDIWLQDIKILPHRLIRCGEKDNFWSMGSTGPCGPCSEIYYDNGPEVWGGLPGTEQEGGDRYVEIWNLVFMQYNRTAEGTLIPLPKTAVDTGMGLERVSAIMQGVRNNYDSDLFKPIIQAIITLDSSRLITSSTMDPSCLKEEVCSLRVIADHIRSCCFLIADGVVPANEGRGYVLRRIIRRALRQGTKLNLHTPFFYKLVQSVVDIMQEAYPEILQEKGLIETILKQEELQFSATLSQGLRVFEQMVKRLKTPVLSGQDVFVLYDTYGFPIDLTADMVREQKRSLDLAGFEVEMAKQRERSKQFSQFNKATYIVSQEDLAPTEFVGYQPPSVQEDNSTPQSTILSIWLNGQSVSSLKSGDQGSVALDCTPFYAESGGQIGDQGILHTGDAVFRVRDTIKQAAVYMHIGQLEKGSLTVGDRVYTVIDMSRRTAIMLNHTATHLLHNALQQILGTGATQKGSLVTADRLRFDFSHSSPLSEPMLNMIESYVNAEIRENHPSCVQVMSLEKALAQGAIGLFGEKYATQVRVVQFGQSIELCGGTHVQYTGEIGLFKITSETGVAASIRRIEAVTGEKALEYLAKCELDFKQSLAASQEKINSLKQQLQHCVHQFAITMSHELCEQATQIGQIQVISTIIPYRLEKAMREMLDIIKQKLQTAIIVLATLNHGKARLMIGITVDLRHQLHANELAGTLAQQMGGKGGGRIDFAEAGGFCSLAELKNILHSVYDLIKQQT